MFGPIEGSRHDAFMLNKSGLTPKLARLVKPNGDPCVIYGDPAYGLNRNIISPFRGANLTDQQQDFNSAMSKVCTSMEWGFGKTIQYFESQSTSSTSCKVLFSWSSFDQLPYMPLWVCNRNLFWFRAPHPWNLFIQHLERVHKKELYASVYLLQNCNNIKHNAYLKPREWNKNRLQVCKQPLNFCLFSQVSQESESAWAPPLLSDGLQ